MDQPPKYNVFLPLVAAMAIPFPFPLPWYTICPGHGWEQGCTGKRDPKIKLNQLVSTLRWSWWLLLLLLLLAQHPLCCLLKQYPHSHPLSSFFGTPSYSTVCLVWALNQCMLHISWIIKFLICLCMCALQCRRLVFVSIRKLRVALFYTHTNHWFPFCISYLSILARPRPTTCFP